MTPTQMTTNLEQNLYTKHPLRFDSEGRFKILMLSDIQETCAFNPLTKIGMEKLLDREKPNLVVLGGDNLNGHKIKTIDEIRRYVQIMAEPMETRKIPWAHIWGNHDHDTGVDEALQEAAFEASEYCVTKTAEGITGQANFVLPVFGHDISVDRDNAGKIKFAIWGLDSGNLCPQNAIMEHKYTPAASVFGDLRFNQVDWYYRSSAELEAYCRGKVAGLMCVHVAPIEIVNIQNNPERCGTIGHTSEAFALGTINAGLFAACLDRGDIVAICSGHTHENDAEGKYMGISLSNDGSIGYSAYGNNARRGGRIFEINESNPFNVKTRFVGVEEK